MFSARVFRLWFLVLWIGRGAWRFSSFQGTTGHLQPVWGRCGESPVIGRLVLRQGPQPLARLIVSTWTLYRLCFPRRHHRLRLDTRRSPPAQKKCRKNGGNRRAQMEDGAVISGAQGATPDSRLPSPSPDLPPCLFLGTGTGDRLRLAGLASQTSNLWAPFQVSILPPQLRHWQKRSGLSRNPGPGPSSWPAPPRRLPQAHAVEVTDRHDIVDRRLVLPTLGFFLFPILSFRPSLHPGWSTPGVWVSPPVGHSFLSCFSSASISLSLGVYTLFNVVITTPAHRQSIPSLLLVPETPRWPAAASLSSSSASRLFTSPVPMRPPPPSPSVFTPRQ